MSENRYDIIFSGAGAAGLQLILKMLEDPFYKDKSFLIIDKSAKDSNDRTWCFWEKGRGSFDDILYSRWENGWFHSTDHSIDLDMGDYSYKMLRSKNFYSFCKEIINESGQVTWVQEEVKSVGPEGKVITDTAEYHGDYIFDSRIPPEYEEDTRSTKLLQHFLGWIVEFEDDVFETEYFTQMDFRDRMPGTCSFMYVLPFDKKRALLEFTFFNDKLISEEEYEEYIAAYIDKHFSNIPFRVEEKEEGIIPMTDFNFRKFHKGKITKIGTAGGWVKPSSGYSFKISQKFIDKVIGNMKAGKPAHTGIAKGKNRFYDSIFLGILKDQNEKGEALFDNMYHKLPAHLIFKFLDERTSFGEDLRIMSKFVNPTFLRAFFRQLLR